MIYLGVKRLLLHIVDAFYNYPNPRIVHICIYKLIIYFIFNIKTYGFF
jgi:hypothetical protein